MKSKLKRQLINEYNAKVSYTPNFQKLVASLPIDLNRKPFIPSSPKRLISKPLFQNLVMGLVSGLTLVVGTVVYLNTSLTHQGSSMGQPETETVIELKPTNLTIHQSLIYHETFGAETIFNSDAISLIGDEEEYAIGINRYGDQYRGAITSLMDNLLESKSLSQYALIISPFVFSSNEFPITLENVVIKPIDNAIELTFTLYSEKLNDLDINVQFFGIAISKDYLANLNLKLITTYFKINNLYDNSSTSAYYR